MQDDLIKDSVGSRCMVLTEDNNFLFAGELTRYDEAQNVIWVEEKIVQQKNASQDVHQPVKPGDVLKLHIKVGNKNRLILIEGTVRQAAKQYFCMLPSSLIEKPDERAYFRQPVMASSLISFVNRNASSAPCMIVDLSATGIALQSNKLYQLGDYLWMYNQAIIPNGALHNLEFLVVRKKTLKDGIYRYFYGCQFVNLSSDEEDKLFSEIFALQNLNLRSSKK